MESIIKVFLLGIVTISVVGLWGLYWTWFDRLWARRRLRMEREAQDATFELICLRIDKDKKKRLVDLPYAPNPYPPVRQGKSTKGDK